MPIYLVSRVIETPEETNGNNKYTDIGMQSKGKYIAASKYPLLLNNVINSGANADIIIVMSINARQNVANNFLASLLKFGFL